MIFSLKVFLFPTHPWHPGRAHDRNLLRAGQSCQLEASLVSAIEMHVTGWSTDVLDIDRAALRDLGIIRAASKHEGSRYLLSFNTALFAVNGGKSSAVHVDAMPGMC